MAVIQKFRKSFGKSFLQTPLPDLVEIQYNSYKDFLQADVAPQNRENKGLQAVFTSMFPIKDYAGIADLEFVEYTLEKPVYNVKECMLRNLTYSRRLKVKLRLILWDVAEDGKKTLRDIKDQEIFMGDVPLMTERGSFIAAGVERVIVSQMHRAQGVVLQQPKRPKLRVIQQHIRRVLFQNTVPGLISKNPKALFMFVSTVVAKFRQRFCCVACPVPKMKRNGRLTRARQMFAECLIRKFYRHFINQFHCHLMARFGSVTHLYSTGWINIV